MQKVRISLGLNQFELSQRLGVHWVTISRWENDHGEPRLGCLQELARLYLDRVLAIGEWIARTSPVRVATFSHGILYELPGMEQALMHYVTQGISLGYQVLYVHPKSEEPPQVLERLCTSSAYVNGQLRFVPLEEVFFHEGRLDLGQVMWLSRKFADQAIELGFKRVRWVADMRPLARSLQHTCDLIAYEYMSDSVFHSQHRSHGVGIYPLPGKDRGLAACVLCRHPWILTPRGPVRNPYYHDAVMCRARILESWGGYGGIGSNSPASLSSQIR